MVAIVQMKLQSRLGYLIMKNWWWTKTQLPKKPFIRSVLELSYLFDWFNPYELNVGAQYQFESHNSFWEHIQTLASFAIPTTPTQEFVVECDHWSDFSRLSENSMIGSKGHQQKISWIVPSCFGRTSIQEKNHHSKWWLSILSLVSLSLSYRA